MTPLPPPIPTNSLQRLQHHNRIASNNHHPQRNLLASFLLLYSVVEDNVQEDVIAAQGAHDFARAVELDEEAFVEVLFVWESVSGEGLFGGWVRGLRAGRAE